MKREQEFLNALRRVRDLIDVLTDEVIERNTGEGSGDMSGNDYFKNIRDENKMHPLNTLKDGCFYYVKLLSDDIFQKCLFKNDWFHFENGICVRPENVHDYKIYN